MNFFVDKEQVIEEYIYINGMDVNHIKNVLRYKENDELNIVCRSNNINYKVKIEEISNVEIKCKILDKIQSKESNLIIDIYQGLPKADKMELIIQKCSELGVSKIIPVNMKRCVVNLQGKDEKKKIDRWNKIAEVAAKQSLRSDILEVTNIFEIKDVCESINNYDIVLVAYEKENDNFIKREIENVKKKNINSKLKIAVIIGTEGGIEEKEVSELINSGAKSISLGNRILRTETAPIVISSILMYELGDIGG